MEAAIQTQHHQSYGHPYLFNNNYADDHSKEIIPLPPNNIYDGLRVSEEEYWLKYYTEADVALEWNNGILEEKPVSDKEGFDLYTWFHRLISQYNETFKEGDMIGLEIGFRLRVGDKVTIRKPDLAFIHKDNPEQMPPLDRSYKGCFDICFEFLSDSTKNDIKRDTVVKKHEYETFGVREYYILDRLGDETAFYYLNSKGLYKPLKPNRYGIIKSRVLKHFQFRLEDLYNRPSDRQLVQDRVYQKFVQIDFQKEQKKAKAERKKAAAERKRAEDADKRLEIERKKVRDAEKKAEAEREKNYRMKMEIKALKKQLAMK